MNIQTKQPLMESHLSFTKNRMALEGRIHLSAKEAQGQTKLRSQAVDEKLAFSAAISKAGKQYSNSFVYCQLLIPEWSGHGFEDMESVMTGEKIPAMADAYQRLADRIKKDYTGEDYKREMSLLDAGYRQAADLVTWNYAGELDRSLNQAHYLTNGILRRGGARQDFGKSIPLVLDADFYGAISKAYRSMFDRAKEYVMNGGESDGEEFSIFVGGDSDVLKYNELRTFWKAIKELKIPQQISAGKTVKEEQEQKSLEWYQERFSQKSAADFSAGLSKFTAELIERLFQRNGELESRFF